jgi:hypothetical protein
MGARGILSSENILIFRPSEIPEMQLKFCIHILRSLNLTSTLGRQCSYNSPENQLKSPLNLPEITYNKYSGGGR